MDYNDHLSLETAMQIKGSVALVTGANRGIGKAIAEELLARGASKVYAGVRDPSSVTDPRLVPVELDVTDAARVAEVAKQLSDVEVVVNNAGVGHAATPLRANLDDARAQLEVNYLGIVSMTQAFAPVLAANGGGAFVNLLSVVSWVGVPNLATYSASKAAAWLFTNAARVELKGQGTQVLAVHVGYVDTELTAGLDVEKIAPQVVVTAVLDALEADESEVVVDEFSRAVKAALHDDLNLIYPGIEAQFEAAAHAH
jgi:NAD(P)-dependent dehydrogenase (short-subunit alcohol dehydrogenase family)